MNVEERIRVEGDGTITAFSGKVEFGQGVRTAFAQVVAEELDVPPERVRMVLGDTAVVPYDGGTYGSRSVAHEWPELRRAAAHARRMLLERAGARLGVSADDLTTEDGFVRIGDRRATYAELVRESPLVGPIPDDVTLRPRDRWRYVGKPAPRAEARDIVTGRARYVADVRLAGMLHGAIVRPAARGARVLGIDDDVAARAMPGVAGIVRDGDLLGVVAERAEQARAAADAIVVDWSIPDQPERATIDIPMRHEGNVDAAMATAAVTRAATYVLPPISNAPIGPSAAIADVRGDGATVYAATHRPFALRDGVARALGIPPERVRFIAQMSSGTYGRSSSYDAPLEAAVLSKHAGRPVHVQWTRAEEFALSPSRPEAVLEIAAGLDAGGGIVGWRYDEHTNVHTSQGLDPRTAAGSSGRNAIPPYRIPHSRVVLHMEPTPLRTANFRSLAAAENVFAIESFMDELAEATGQEPVAFRLRHLDDPRLRRVIEGVAMRAGWGRKLVERRGLGLACTLYHGTYVAQVAEVDVASSGKVRLLRMWCVVDPGIAVNPDGVRNQVEGGIQQAASWTILEELRHRHGRVVTTGWDSYPIATFRDAPEEIDVLVQGDADAPPTGVGEPGSVPTAAAIANAVYAACGARVRELPLSRERVRGAMAVG